MENDAAREFASHRGRALITAAAGCGKTELIARAVSLNRCQRQLILTHTHAGVRVLRERLRKHNVPVSQFRLATIDSWCLQYVQVYPQLAQLDIPNCCDISWRDVHRAADRLLTKHAARRIVALSYSGVYVDEYQDCSPTQHSVIMRLAEFLLCRIVGDPLQGIFSFGDGIVEWSRDVCPNFEPLAELKEGHRWKDSPDLGKWLEKMRARLLDRQTIDLRDVPAALKWRPLTGTAQDAMEQQKECRSIELLRHSRPSSTWRTHGLFCLLLLQWNRLQARPSIAGICGETCIGR